MSGAGDDRAAEIDADEAEDIAYASTDHYHDDHLRRKKPHVPHIAATPTEQRGRWIPGIWYYPLLLGRWIARPFQVIAEEVEREERLEEQHEQHRHHPHHHHHGHPHHRHHEEEAAGGGGGSGDGTKTTTTAVPSGEQ